MKRFSNLNEACVTTDVNPGNAYSQTGVSNHYSPVENILTNIKNLYCTRLGIVAAVAEDGVSIKLHSTKFINEREINKLLNEVLYNDGMGIAGYIQSQGLDKVSMVNLGQYYVVYFSPSDVKTAEPGVESTPCQEMLDFNITEAEMFNCLINESDDDVELEDETKKSLIELVKSKDKIKAAKQFAAIVAKEVALPNDYYFTGVKDAEGKESIALRWRYIKRRPFNKSSQSTRSLINIYDDGKEGIWVQDFDKDAMFHIPDEVRKLIENILDILGAKETKDPCVYSLEADKDDKKDDKKDEDKDKDKDNSDNDSSSSNDDTEDDDSRGGGDDLLS